MAELKNSKTNQDILQRLMKYCAGMERSTHDIVSRLEEWNVAHDQREDILEQLRLEKFLDDKRYVRSYVTEKWNLDHWGKIKIKNSLQQKNIDEDLIEDMLSSIDDLEYTKVLDEVLQKKWKDVKYGNQLDEAKRLMMYAQSKGFEEELILDWLSKNSFPGQPYS